MVSGLGGDLETENRAGDLRCPSVKTAAMASLQGSWCCLERWGGRVGRGGALGGEAVAVAATNGVGGDGGARAERTEEGESVRGRERKV